MTNNYMQVLAQQGWQCPLCKRIYGPFVQECYHCNNQKTTVTTSTTGTDNETITLHYSETPDTDEAEFNVMLNHVPNKPSRLENEFIDESKETVRDVPPEPKIPVKTVKEGIFGKK